MKLPSTARVSLSKLILPGEDPTELLGIRVPFPCARRSTEQLSRPLDVTAEPPFDESLVHYVPC